MMLAVALAFIAASASPAEPARLRLWRIDCGNFGPKQLVNSCYLIRHGRSLMIWDAGFAGEWVGKPPSPETRSTTVRASLMSELARIGIRPEQVDIIAVSHLHWDHIGQAASFPKARLLIGKEDWEALTAPEPDSRLEPGRLAPWIKGGAPMEAVTGDKDVFGDGSVMMIATPGHTLGHHALLVRLPHFGPVMLSGDLYYSTAQHRDKLVSKGSADQAKTAESFRRFDDMAMAEKASVIIQHEPADVAKLPMFPKAAD
jgi:N-acyl homoserine lactone hydrolase